MPEPRSSFDPAAEPGAGILLARDEVFLVTFLRVAIQYARFPYVISTCSSGFPYEVSSISVLLQGPAGVSSTQE